jgi:hypothetical protein
VIATGIHHAAGIVIGLVTAVSAYTQSGCLEDLHAAAKRAGVEVRLKDVQTDLGWEIFLFPFYKGYKCTGEITGPARAGS